MTNQGGIEPENKPNFRTAEWGVGQEKSGQWSWKRVANRRRARWRPVLDSFKGYFFGFSRGCRRPISAARSLTLWTLPNGPSLLQLKHTSLSGIAFLSGPTCDRANRVTQACRLKRIASQHD